MAGEIKLFIDMLLGKDGAAAAVQSLRSLDATVKVNDSSIKALEKSYVAAQEAASKALAAGDKRGASKAAREAAGLQAEIGRRGKENANANATAAAIGIKNAAAEGAARRASMAEATKNAAEEAKRAAQKRKDIISQTRDNAALLKAQRGLADPAKKAKSATEELTSQLSAAGGPAASLVSRLQSLGKMGVAGIVVVIVAAIAAFVAVGIAAAAAATSYAFSLADAARSSRLFSEAATGSAAAGQELETVVDQMSNLAPGLSAKLKEMGRGLADINIRGRDAQRTLNTFGILATARGEQAANAIKNIAESSRMTSRLMLGPLNRMTGEFDSLRATGIKSAEVFEALSKVTGKTEEQLRRGGPQVFVPFRKGIEALESIVEKKFGGVVAKQMMSLSNQAAKLKENIGKLFTGVNLEPFLAGLKTVTDLFSQDTVTGYVLRRVFTMVFSKIAEVAGKVFPYVVQAIRGVVTGVLITVDMAKTLYKQFQQTFGGATSNIDGIALAFKVGAGIVGLFVGSIVALTVAITFFGLVAVAALAPIWVPIALLVAAMYGAVLAFRAGQAAAKSFVTSLGSIDLAATGGKIIDGLVKGLKSKIADVKSAIMEISNAITGTITGDQEVRSPGEKPKRIGRHIGEGYAIGIESKEGRVESASMGVSGGATSGFGGPQPAGPRGQSIVNNYTYAPVFNGPTNSEDALRLWDEWLDARWKLEARGVAT